MKNFTYEAIYIPKGIKKPSKNLLLKPELKIYYEDFHHKKDDYCIIYKIIGAVWIRLINDYGYIDDNTPSLAISLYKEYRWKGLGTKLILSMFKLLKDNYAKKLYLNVSFNIIKETKEEYIMLKIL